MAEVLNASIVLAGLLSSLGESLIPTWFLLKPRHLGWGSGGHFNAGAEFIYQVMFLNRFACWQRSRRASAQAESSVLFESEQTFTPGGFSSGQL